MDQSKDIIKRVISTNPSAENNPLRNYMDDDGSALVFVGRAKSRFVSPENDWDVMIISDNELAQQVLCLIPEAKVRWYWLVHGSDCIARQRAALEAKFGRLSAEPELFHHDADGYSAYLINVARMLESKGDDGAYDDALAALDRALIMQPTIDGLICKLLWSAFAVRIAENGGSLQGTCEAEFGRARQDLLRELELQNAQVPELLSSASTAGCLTDDTFRELKRSLVALVPDTRARA